MDVYDSFKLLVVNYINSAALSIQINYFRLESANTKQKLHKNFDFSFIFIETRWWIKVLSNDLKHCED